MRRVSRSFSGARIVNFPLEGLLTKSEAYVKRDESSKVPPVLRGSTLQKRSDPKGKNNDEQKGGHRYESEEHCQGIELRRGHPEASTVAVRNTTMRLLYGDPATHKISLSRSD